MKSIQIKTFGDRIYNHWVSVIGKTEVVFTIKACGNALILLAATPHVTNTNAYEIEIQRTDGKTVLRSSMQGREVVQKTQTGKLNFLLAGKI